MKKISAFLIMLGLILGITSFSPTIEAKTTYKTLSFDKEMETKQDFEKGEFKNTKLEAKNNGIEMSSPDGQKGEYITPVIQAPFGANYIGLHWKKDLADDSSIVTYLRTSNDGVDFGNWVETTLEIDEGKDGAKTEETFAVLIGTDKTNFAQAKIEFVPENGISPKLKAFTFTFINSGEESKQVTKKLSLAPSSTAEGVGTLKTSPNGRSINVISREDWGADESLRLNADGTENWPRSYHGTRKLIVHHTAVASSNGVTDLEANKANVRAIYSYHASTQGWGDIGYNALVDAAGNVYEGRYGTHGTSLTRTAPTPDDVMTLDVEAAQAANYNSGSFGVSAMGDFTNFNVPANQLASMENVLAYVADARGINTQGKSDFLRYDGTWHSDLNNVVAHRDVAATACPGTKLYSLMTTIKTYVNSLMLSNLSSFSATMNGNSISGKDVGLGIANFSWGAFPNATQYQYVLERVYGTTGSANNNEPWETAWFNPENTNIGTTSDTNVQIDTGSLQLNSNYVFYARAINASGASISTTAHVNFKRNSSMIADTAAPTAQITKPANGATVSGTVSISATATDDVGVVLSELYIDGKKVASAATGALNYSWNTKKISRGTHTISVKAYDAAGNVGSASITVTK